MRIRSIRLHPYAAIQDKTFSFENGLNILLGPNEAGKSTLFQAVVHGLLTSTSKTARQLEDEMGNFFPVGGGDIIRLKILLELEEGSQVHIQKTWKKGNREGSASIRLPDGTEITNEEDVQKQIFELLPVSPATMRTILLSNQSGLQETLKQMKQEEQVRNELGAVLRKSVMETGGISVDRFRKIVDDKFENYFKKWNRGQQYPENNRGIQNPYKVGLGKVVEAFYRKEKSKIDYESALEFEQRLDGLNKEIGWLTEQLQEKKQDHEKLSPLKSGIQRRQNKEYKLKEIGQELESIREINKQWPLLDQRLESIATQIKELEQHINQYQQELQQVQKQQELRMLKERIQNLEDLKKKAGEMKREVEEATQVTEEQITDLRNFNVHMDRLEARVEAAKLRISVEGKVDTEFDWQEVSKENSETISLNKGDEKKRTATGGFTLETNELKISVFSGDGDIEQTVQELEEKGESFSRKLKEAGAQDLQEAESMERLYRDKLFHLEQAENQFREGLGDDDLEMLKQKLEEYKPDKEVRDSIKISEDLAEATSRRDGLEKEKLEKEGQLAEWKNKYDNHDKVAEALGDLLVQYRDLNKEVEVLPDLPKEFESAESFLNYMDQLDQEISELKEKISENKEGRARLEGQASDTSSEELNAQKQEAEAEFERINREAEILARVQEKTEELLNSLDVDTFKGVKDSFLKWLSIVSGKRFKTVRMEQDMPEAFVTNNKQELTFQLLSHGTKGSVALAWRFALCDHLMDKRLGVVVLDDPLVDMDPDRRNQAVDGIYEFSKKHQVLVMTCHPEHAKEMEQGYEVKFG
ncbi:MAG: AAA family ATPase [Deltaproteobacteria bacterium]